MGEIVEPCQKCRDLTACMCPKRYLYLPMVGVAETFLIDLKVQIIFTTSVMVQDVRQEIRQWVRGVSGCRPY